MDTVVATKDEMWIVEHKHKFPFVRDGTLFLGINTGELDLLDRMAGCGLRVLHLVVVKPHREKSRGSLELFTDGFIRSRTRVLALEFDADVVTRLRGGPVDVARSTARQSGSALTTHRIPVRWFEDLGALSDPALPSAIADKLHGVHHLSCSEDMLEAVRVDR